MFKINQSLMFLLCLSLLLGIGSADAFEKLKKRRPITASVIIPCHYKHAVHLKEALEAYAAQTVVPNEVVISLSEAYLVPEETLNALAQKKWPFSLNLLQFNERVSEGGNRNNACKAAKGDILICSDADDLPHWQRVEIIKYFFERYPIDYLTHKHVFETDSWTTYYPKKIGYTIPKFVNEGGPHANSAITVSRAVVNRFKWNAEFRKAIDAEFNGAVYHHFPNGMLIDVPLLHYRFNFSVYPPD